MVKTVRGKYHSGTWLHSKIILHFLRWGDVDLEIAMEEMLNFKYAKSAQLKLIKTYKQKIKDLE